MNLPTHLSRRGEGQPIVAHYQDSAIPFSQMTPSARATILDEMVRRYNLHDTMVESEQAQESAA